MHGEHHLHVQTCLEAGLGVMNAVDEIAHHEPVKPPLVAEDVRKQALRGAAVFAVELVVGAHDRLCPGIDALLKVGEIDLVQRADG